MDKLDLIMKLQFSVYSAYFSKKIVAPFCRFMACWPVKSVCDKTISLCKVLRVTNVIVSFNVGVVICEVCVYWQSVKGGKNILDHKS